MWILRTPSVKTGEKYQQQLPKIARERKETFHFHYPKSKQEKSHGL
jgi:hypothetical protein